MKAIIRKLVIGDTVLWRGSWGRDNPKFATIESIDINCVKGYGIATNSVGWDKMVDKTVVVSLTNGKWAYGHQISKAFELN